MITISVILKKPGPAGVSFVDYAFEDSGRVYPAKGFRAFICAGLRTSNGVVFAHVVPDLGGLPDQRAIAMSFPSQIDGKPLVTKRDEKVEFRWVVMQRVFETTFTIDASDLPDGSQAGLYLPAAVTDLKKHSGSSAPAYQ
jgi:hypothetical protein